MATEEIEIEREDYLRARVDDNSGEILRAYFNRVSGLLLDEANFFAIMFQVLAEHPGLQKDIDEMYPNICLCYDQFFTVTFIVKQYGDTRRLIGVL